MDTFICETRAQLIAAITAAAHDDWEQAPPFEVRLGDRCVYTFKHGVSTKRAQQIARTIRKTPAIFFRVDHDADP